MKRFLQLLLPGAAAVTAAITGRSQGQQHDQWTQESSNRFIVEFADAATLGAENQLGAVDGVKVVQTFQSSVFHGASIELHGLQVADILALAEVTAIWPNELVDLVPPVKQQKVKASDAAKYDVHWATGVDDVHRNGQYGTGAKVGIIDTGIWYKHSALGGGFGDGFKVAGGWDFVGDHDWSPGDEKHPDNDPIDQQGHGTHVAGIISGESSEGWKGVAPNASLYAYKVFSTGSTTDAATIIDAFLRAHTDGVDVIVASITGRNGFVSNPCAVVASRLVDNGIIVTITAGSSGEVGPFYAGSGGSGDGVLSVASVHSQASKKRSLPSPFTSWGGLYDLGAKPDVAAPGTEIFSTWPGKSNDADGSFAVLSGTAMAPPYVAGAAALWIGKFGNRNTHTNVYARYITMRLITSCKSLPWVNSDGSPSNTFKAPPQQVGAGLINASFIIAQASSLAYQRFSLNDTANFQSKQVLTLENIGTGSTNYTFHHTSGAGFEMFEGSIRTRRELKPTRFEASVQLPASVEVGQYKQQEVEFVFMPPKGLDESKLPVYGGIITIKAINGDELVVPYQGVAFSLQKQFTKNMFADTYPRLGSAPTSDSTKKRFTFDLSLSAQDFPKIFWKLNWGTKELRFDIYGPNFKAKRDWSYPPVVGENNYVGSAAPWIHSNAVKVFNPSNDDSNNTYNFPLTDVSRNAYDTSKLFWFGKLADGSYIQPGRYLIRFGSLIPFSDPYDYKSWSVLEVEIEVLNK